MIVAVVGSIALPSLIDTGDGTKDIGFSGTTPGALPAAIQAQGDAVATKTRVHLYTTRAEGEQSVRDGKSDLLVVDGYQLEWQRRADEQLKAVVTAAIQIVAVQDRANAAGISANQLATLLTPVPVTNVELGQVAGRSPDDETAAFIMTVILFMAIATYGGMVLSGVVEEKSSRVVEVLLARIPARNLLAGKIAGIGLLGLAQIAATAGASTPRCSVPSGRSRHGPKTRKASPAPSPSSLSSSTSCPSPSSEAPTPPGPTSLRGSPQPHRLPCPPASPWAQHHGGIRCSQ
jgi:ABC-2 type transport system permease protein